MAQGCIQLRSIQIGTALHVKSLKISIFAPENKKH
nr:MAG TPA: hypothetical protein [Bacteriophage sp.]